MITSKYINVIAIVLIITAVVFSFWFVLNPETEPAANLFGKISYKNGQSITVTADDYYTDYTKGYYSKITLSGNDAVCDNKNVQITDKSIKIFSGGIYELSGAYNGSITVSAENNSPVRLVLANAEIISDSFSLYVEKAGKVIISTAKDTVNTFTATKEADSDINAVIYSKSDITFNGEGTLDITTNLSDGIKTNDAMTINGGALNITVQDDGINVNDYIAFIDGDITVSSGGDSIKCINNDNNTYGFIVFEGGAYKLTSGADGIDAGNDIYINKADITLNSADDGIHAEKNLYLNGGKVNIESCTEGLEGAYIEINDGEYNIVSKDDAVNATGENSTGRFMGRPGGNFGGTLGEVYLKINGGKIYALVGGDGIDSNSAAEINGGYIEVYGPENSGNSTMDFDGGYVINGGTVISAGSAGMAESPQQSSEQNTITLTLSQTFEPKTEITLNDTEGNIILSGTSEKKFNWICLSSPLIETGKEYTVTVGDEEEIKVTINSKITAVLNGNSGFGRRGF